MAEFISHRETIVITERSVTFRFLYPASRRGAGFSFECDENGQIDKIGPYAWANLNYAIGGYCDDAMSCDVTVYEHTYREPAVLRCDCGGEVVLYSSDANDCDGCDQLYNMSGQRVNCSWREMPEWNDPEAIADERFERMLFGE